MVDVVHEPLQIDFRGAEGGHGPSTWGQRHIWAAVLDNRGDPARFTMRRSWSVPGGRTVVDVVAALRALVERHETLRSRIDIDRGIPVQVVGESGTLACSVTDSAAPWSREAALRSASELPVSVYGPGGEPPVRFGVLTFEGGPQWITVAISHLLVDADGCGMLEAELHALLSGSGTPPHATYQPRQRARFEQSVDGRAHNARALRYWRTTLEQHPEWLFPPRTDGIDSWRGERFPVLHAYAPGLGRHVEQVADRLRVSTPALCLAAFGKAFSARSAAAAYPLGVTFSNRVLPWSRGYVGTLAQQGAIGVRDVHVPLGQLARRMWQSLLLGHRFSQYEQDDVFDLISQAYDGQRDGYGPVANFVNFQYRPALTGTPPSAEDPAGRALVFTELSPQEDSSVRFGLHISSDRSDLVLRMSLDQACVHVDTMRDVLDGAAGELWSVNA
ncbi:condensation domain-containing protein [Streptomyces sp. NPDC002928]|uniref:condensation domain-containing protein n=1 Tax=Streptomyces sp. NPDC002928 TaxID=3154440 RepID=UPI0033A6D04C